jgi:hypothetical protein
VWRATHRSHGRLSGGLARREPQKLRTGLPQGGLARERCWWLSFDYSPSLHHLYAPSKSGTLGIVAISAAGAPTVLGAAPVPSAVQGVTTDGHGAVWIGDPAKGRILRVEDRYPASP